MTSIIDWLHSELGKIEHKLFKDVVKVEHSDKRPIGDGQVVVISDIGRVTFTLTTSGGEIREVKAIVKCESSAPIGKHLADLWGCFDTEIKMYSKFLKSLEKLMSEINDKEYIWADCYHCGDNKLVFQDLCEVGYQIVPTHKYLDLEHSLIVMKAIGKYHALSMVMRERGHFDSNEFMNEPYYVKQTPVMDERLNHRISSLIQAIKDDWGPEWSSFPDRMSKYFSNPLALINKSWNESRGKWDVLNHGDFSIRNMLFHYPPGTSHPDGVKFVDFQMCHYSNLANDLITLLYSSLRPQLREENMDLLLNTYVKSLASTANKFNYKGQLPTLQDVHSSIHFLHPVIFLQIIFFVPWFIMSGKADLQKIADENMKTHDSWDKVLEQNRNEDKDFMAYSDKDVKDVLQYEFMLLINKNIL